MASLNNFSSSGSRLEWIDRLRLIACIAVVFVHVTGQAYSRFETGLWEEWWLANVMSGSSRASVPLFIMISGATLRREDCDALSFYRKKALRFFPLVLIWTALYATFDVYVMGHGLADVLIGFVFNGFVYLHLWYLTMFAIMLAFAPFLARVKFKIPYTSNDWRLLIVLCFTFFTVDWALTFASRATGIVYGEWVGTFLAFIPYYLLGAWLSTPQSVGRSRLYGIFLVLALVGSLILNWLSCRFLGIINDSFPLSNNSPLVFAVAVTLFLFVRCGCNSGSKSPKWLAILAETSLGIYLLHPFFIWLFVRLARDWKIDLLGGWWMFLTAISAFLASLGCTIVLRRLPLGRKIC